MLQKMIDPQSVVTFAQWVEKYQRFVIIGHVSPDGDAVGATLALWHYLKGKGKEAQVVMPNSFPDFLRWLPGAENVFFYRNTNYNQKNEDRVKKLLAEAEVICCLDFNELTRIEEVGELVHQSKAHKLLLDHHLHPEYFADVTISFPEQSSACELLFRFLQDLGHYEEMNVDTAACLYTGMMTDTGGFTYNSSRSEIFYIVSLLLAKGIDKDVIYRKVYHNYTSARLQLQGEVLSRMTYLPEFHTVVITLSKEEQLRHDYHRGDSEGFVNLPLEIRDVMLTCFLREDTERDQIKISFRSIGDFSCQQVAKRFGGGGHKNASGAERYGTSLEQVKQEFISLLPEYKEELEKCLRKEQKAPFCVCKR